MNNMNFCLPFYGKKGTISNIKEDTKFYLVYRYGMSEKDVDLFYVPKNDNNLNALLDNFYSDLKGYLDYNTDKYESFKKSRLNKPINSTYIKAMFGISISMLLISIPLINTHEVIGFVGALLDTFAIPTALYATSEFVKLHDDNKKAKFMKHFNNLSHKYQSGVKSNNAVRKETIYQGLNNINNIEHVNDLSKTKSLKPDIKKNAA